MSRSAKTGCLPLTSPSHSRARRQLHARSLAHRPAPLAPRLPCWIDRSLITTRALTLASGVAPARLPATARRGGAGRPGTPAPCRALAASRLVIRPQGDWDRVEPACAPNRCAAAAASRRLPPRCPCARLPRPPHAPAPAPPHAAASSPTCCPGPPRPPRPPLRPPPPRPRWMCSGICASTSRRTTATPASWPAPRSARWSCGTRCRWVLGAREGPGWAWPCVPPAAAQGAPCPRLPVRPPASPPPTLLLPLAPLPSCPRRSCVPRSTRRASWVATLRFPAPSPPSPPATSTRKKR